MISAIAAVDSNYGIGYKGELLFNIKEDLKQFKELTSNNIVIMGRKTWDSLPNKPLPNRTNIVITRKTDNIGDANNNVFYLDLDNAKDFLSNKDRKNDNVFIIGGGQIYKELLPYCDRIYLTRMYKSFEADTYFPDINIDNDWKLAEASEVKEIDNIKYQFCTYDRVNYMEEDNEETDFCY